MLARGTSRQAFVAAQIGSAVRRTEKKGDNLSTVALLRSNPAPPSFGGQAIFEF
jgi:hypothetical protein